MRRDYNRTCATLASQSPQDTRPLVIDAHLEGISNPTLFRLDSGTNVPLIYGGRDQSPDFIRTTGQILKREVDGVEQDFAMLRPKDISINGQWVHQVSFVEPRNSIGAAQQSREDGLLPTHLFQRVFVSYRNRFAILDPK